MEGRGLESAASFLYQNKGSTPFLIKEFVLDQQNICIT